MQVNDALMQICVFVSVTNDCLIVYSWKQKNKTKINENVL